MMMMMMMMMMMKAQDTLLAQFPSVDNAELMPRPQLASGRARAGGRQLARALLSEFPASPADFFPLPLHSLSSRSHPFFSFPFLPPFAFVLASCPTLSQSVSRRTLGRHEDFRSFDHHDVDFFKNLAESQYH